ncbi:MAG: RsmB/NOP family class I SAM-dependent RNA methyltransferase [Promethearchaeota archaeon]
MVERYIDFLGLEETIELLKANERPLTPSIRVNTLKIEVKTIKKRLENKGFALEPIKWVEYGFNISKFPFNLGALHEHIQGYYYIQSVATMLPALILNPHTNDVVIDMCAAPGGKATHLTQIMNNQGKLILLERNERRIPALEVNLRRMGITNSIVLNHDASHLEKLNIKADRILLDAPCTGEGLIRQDKSRKKSKNINDIKKMASVQKKLLSAGLDALKPGGHLLYCTCSIAPEENEIVVDQVLKGKSNFIINEIKNKFGSNGLTYVYGKNLINDLRKAQRFYPHIHDTIGFFICLISKST